VASEVLYISGGSCVKPTAQVGPRRLTDKLRFCVRSRAVVHKSGTGASQTLLGMSCVSGLPPPQAQSSTAARLHSGATPGVPRHTVNALNACYPTPSPGYDVNVIPSPAQLQGSVRRRVPLKCCKRPFGPYVVSMSSDLPADLVPVTGELGACTVLRRPERTRHRYRAGFFVDPHWALPLGAPGKISKKLFSGGALHTNRLRNFMTRMGQEIGVPYQAGSPGSEGHHTLLP
jgi:hypothetical protein